MSQASQGSEANRNATDLDLGIQAIFDRQPPALPGWTCRPTGDTLHSYHVSLAEPEPASLSFGLIADAADGVIEVVSLLGLLQPGIEPTVVLQQLNEIHAAVLTGRFLLTGEPARIVYEAELILGEGDNRATLVERLLPVLLSEMAATIAEEMPHLERFLVRPD